MRSSRAFPTRRSSDLPHRGVAMGLNVFMLFIGFGLGSLIFSGVLQWGISTAFVVFGIVALFASALERHKIRLDRKSTRLNSSHVSISYAVFCLKKKKN